MSNDTLTLDEVRRMAAAIGLDQLSDEHLRQLTRAANVTHTRRHALPFSSLTWSDEPAHVYRLHSGDER
jgi:hypothetical protein